MGAALSGIQGDYIMVGATVGAADTVQITDINYTTNTLTVDPAFTRADGEYIWLYKKSDGDVVLSGAAPDYGAHEYISDAPVYYSVTVTKGTGNPSTVTATNAYIDCGNVCSDPNVASGTVVTLDCSCQVGNPVWTGCDSVAGGDCTVTVNGDESITVGCQNLLFKGKGKFKGK
ncbi:hypothetical protein HWQ67_18870 [Candidatus Magnetobacterium casensis]|uniref:Uncharacterized protein n=2 Tax=Candidatus Magnetobacterium casense TaxID=1455061 RepID=A0ABS6S451_9BACT|nr:hypothetical protein [Candidatus Magnetobacterium casensis]